MEVLSVCKERRDHVERSRWTESDAACTARQTETESVRSCFRLVDGSQLGMSMDAYVHA
jgi:hypothetical protein